MANGYKHLSAEERDLLTVWKSEGESLRTIARKLGRNPGTISRELKRNAPPIRSNCYLPHKAQKRYMDRNRERAIRPKLKSERIRRYVTRLLTNGWSPELISGRMARRGSRKRISHESIYKWIYAEARHLIPLLARSHRKRHPRKWTRSSRKTRIMGRIHVSKRPVEANERRRVGDWETDTIGRRLSAPALQVIVDRKSRYTILNWIPKRNARFMRTALNRSLCRYPRSMRKTITYDNGGENAGHLQTNKVLGTKSYFCTPYTAQERGTVENTAGLVRRMFPKDTNFGTVSRREVKKVEYWLNHRPRKILDYKTPAEAFRSGVALTG